MVLTFRLVWCVENHEPKGHKIEYGEWYNWDTHWEIPLAWCAVAAGGGLLPRATQGGGRRTGCVSIRNAHVQAPPPDLLILNLWASDPVLCVLRSFCILTSISRSFLCPPKFENHCSKPQFPGHSSSHDRHSHPSHRWGNGESERLSTFAKSHTANVCQSGSNPSSVEPYQMIYTPSVPCCLILEIIVNHEKHFPKALFLGFPHLVLLLLPIWKGTYFNILPLP